MEIRTGRHCVFLMHVHLVFVTKYRRKVFSKHVLDDLRYIFDGVCRSYEAQLIEFEGEDDHVHLLVNYPPKVQISKLVNSLKTASSRVIRKKGYTSVQKALWAGASSSVAELTLPSLLRKKKAGCLISPPWIE